MILGVVRKWEYARPEMQILMGEMVLSPIRFWGTQFWETPNQNKMGHQVPSSNHDLGTVYPGVPKNLYGHNFVGWVSLISNDTEKPHVD